MNIGIFETQHFESAYPLIRILDTPGNHLTIFVNESTYNHCIDLFGKDMQRFSWIVQPKNISNRRFIWTIFTISKKNKQAVLFLNTVTANFIWYGWMAAFMPSVKVILTLHDANSFLQSHFTANLRESVRHTGKKILAHFCYAYCTISETVQEYIKKTLLIQKQVYCIPGAVYEERQNPAFIYKASQQLRIVVPGSIDNRRRDYGKVIDLLNQINSYALPIIIVLAGGPHGSYGQRMLEKFRKYSLSHANLVYWESPLLDQSVFDAELDNAHFIWVPSVITTIIDDGIQETYGLTKSSGNIFDAVKHAKPLLVPIELRMPPLLMSSIFAYDTIETLFDFLSAIIKSPGIYTSLSGEALNNSMNYTTEKMRIRIKDLFDSSL